LRAHPDQADAIIGKALGISPQEAKDQLNAIQNPDEAHLGDVFAHKPTLPSFYASGVIIGGILKREGQIDQVPSIDNTFDARFVKTAQTRDKGE
jgi:NitT/TauT family transport system substrate-binding protein